jgi:hypothetical protein
MYLKSLSTGNISTGSVKNKSALVVDQKQFG